MAMPALTVAALGLGHEDQYDSVHNALRNLNYRALNESRPKLVDSYGATGAEADNIYARQLSIHQQNLAGAALDICVETNRLCEGPITADLAIRGIATILNRDQMWRLRLLDVDFQERARANMGRLRRKWRTTFDVRSNGGPIDQLADKAGNPYWNTPEGYVHHSSNATSEVKRIVGVRPYLPQSKLGNLAANLSGNTIHDWLRTSAESATAALLPAQAANERAAHLAARELLHPK